MRSQPEKSLMIFHDRLDNVTGQAVLRCENGECPLALIEQVKTAPGTDPEALLPVLSDGGDIVVAEAVGVVRVTGIQSELAGLRVKPAQPGLRP